MAVPRNPVTIDTSDTFNTWLSNTNLAINVLKNIITDTVLTHPSAAAFTVGSTITQATTLATGVVQVSTTEATTLSDLGTGTWGISNDVTQSAPTSVTVAAASIDAVTVSHLATTDAALTTPTLTTPIIASNIQVGANTLTLPISADTLVGRATTDTLTNKTLTSPIIVGGSMSGIAITNTPITSAATISVDDGGTIGSDTTAAAMTIASTGIVTFGDDIIIKNTGTIGSVSDPDAISISAAGVVAITNTTANTSTSDGALTIAGGLGIAADATIGDDLRLISDDAILSFGANSDVAFTHVHNDGLILKNTGANTTVLTIQSSDTDVADGNILGEIDFQAPSEGAGTDAILVAASIAARSEGDFSATNNATELVFKTGVSEDASTGAADGDMILSSTGTLNVTGGFGQGVLAKSADYTILPTDANIILVTTSTNNITMTLPAASAVPGKVYRFMKVDSGGTGNAQAGAHNITGRVIIARAGSDTMGINANLTMELWYQGNYVDLMSDGTSSWLVMSTEMFEISPSRSSQSGNPSNGNALNTWMVADYTAGYAVVPPGTSQIQLKMLLGFTGDGTDDGANIYLWPGTNGLATLIHNGHAPVFVAGRTLTGNTSGATAVVQASPAPTDVLTSVLYTNTLRFGGPAGSPFNVAFASETVTESDGGETAIVTDVQPEGAGRSGHSITIGSYHTNLSSAHAVTEYAYPIIGCDINRQFEWNLYGYGGASVAQLNMYARGYRLG